MSLLALRRSGADAERQYAGHTDAVTAVTRLSVLLGPEELDVASALDYALGLISNEKIAAGAAATESLRVVLHSWYRGEVRGSAIGDLYGEQLERSLRRSESSATN